MESPGRTVLVVDDDASIRLLCRLNLELAGWSVHDAGTLQEARAELELHDIEVVLLDVHVGTASGLDFLDELRRERPRVKVALLTGSEHVGETASDGVIPKPFTLEQLTSTMANLAG
ncbi:MAG TPA: response regulator [Gaiellaceae bacterium]|nr:response regulator [Gaiellaceae bacterium]